jgi:hypothetical protein
VVAAIYLAACCLSRLTDDQAQPRIRQEAVAYGLFDALHITAAEAANVDVMLTTEKIEK